MNQPASLHQTARRLRRIMAALGAVILLAEAVVGVVWSAHLGSRPALTVGVTMVASVVLLATTTWVVSAVSRGSSVVVVAASSYLVKIVVLLGSLLGAHAGGLQTRMMGISLLVVIIVTVGAEVMGLTRARIPIITPTEDQPGVQNAQK